MVQLNLVLLDYYHDLTTGGANHTSLPQEQFYHK
jgi:hypothetical protein